MQQFRPLPRFDLLEEAGQVEMPPAPTTDPIPALNDPRFAAPVVQPDFPIPTMTDPRLTAQNAQRPAFPLPSMTDPRLAVPQAQSVPTQTDPRFAAMKAPPAFPIPTLTDPRLAAMQAQQMRTTTGRVPVVVRSGSHTTSHTDRMAAQPGKALSTSKHPSLTTALLATMGTGAASSETNRYVVIPGARKKRNKVPARRLNPRLRQGVVLLATLIIAVLTLTTLVPLSDSQNGGNIFSNIGGWIRSVQLDWNIQAHQSNNNIPTALNGPGLPYMAIANSPYVSVAEHEAVAAGIPPVYFVRQIQQESGFNPNAVSVTNAQGIAQFEPATAAGLGVNPWDPNDALRGAARLMANYYHQYGNYAKALGAYNAGSGAVQGAVYSCGMYWLGCMPAQTQNYVYRIMGI